MMEYTPRYAQPFTLREAVALDVEVITEGKWYDHQLGRRLIR